MKVYSNLFEFVDLDAMAVDSSEDVQVVEVEEVVDGQVRKVRRTIRTKVVEEVEEVVEETETETETEPEPETIVTTETVVTEAVENAASFANQLICQCVTPSGNTTFCLVTDNQDGTYTVDINASEPGVHTVDVELEGRKIPGSPFLVRIVQAADKKKVLLYGKGLNAGLLDDFESLIHVDTKGAGPGDLKVRVHGPKNGFTVTMDHDYHDSRVVNINYHPSIPGIYTVSVYWSGEHVAGSPSEIYLAPNVELLNDWFSNPEQIREMEGLTDKY